MILGGSNGKSTLIEVCLKGLLKDIVVGGKIKKDEEAEGPCESRTWKDWLVDECV